MARSADSAQDIKIQYDYLKLSGMGRRWGVCLANAVYIVWTVHYITGFLKTWSLSAGL